MPNMGVPAGADGAFERFLTAAIATIVTIMFSWRLLLDEEEARAQVGGHPSVEAIPQIRRRQGSSTDGETSFMASVAKVHNTSFSSRPAVVSAPNLNLNSDSYNTDFTPSIDADSYNTEFTPSIDADESMLHNERTRVIETVFEPERDLELLATRPSTHSDDDDDINNATSSPTSADDTLTTWDDYFNEETHEDRGTFHTRRSFRDFVTVKPGANENSVDDDNELQIDETSQTPQHQNFTQRLADFHYSEPAGGSGYIDLYPDVESDEDSESTDDEHVYNVHMSDSDSDSCEEDGAFFGVSTLEPILEEEGEGEGEGNASWEDDEDEHDDSNVNYPYSKSAPAKHTQGVRTVDTTTEVQIISESVGYLKSSANHATDATDIDVDINAYNVDSGTRCERTQSPVQITGLSSDTNPTTATTCISQSVYDFTPEQSYTEAGGVSKTTPGASIPVTVQVEREECSDLNTPITTTQDYGEMSSEGSGSNKYGVETDIDRGETGIIVQRLENKTTELTGNTAFVIDLSLAHTNSYNATSTDTHVKTKPAAIPYNAHFKTTVVEAETDPELKSISELSDEDSLPSSPVRTYALDDDDDDLSEERFSDTESCSSESVITVLSVRSGDFDFRGLDVELEENRLAGAVSGSSNITLMDGNTDPSQPHTLNVDADQREINETSTRRTAMGDCFPEDDMKARLSPSVNNSGSYEYLHRGDSSYDEMSSTPESKSTESLIAPDHSDNVYSHINNETDILNGSADERTHDRQAGSDNDVDYEHDDDGFDNDYSSDSSDPPLREYDPEDDDLAEFHFDDSDPDSFYLVVGDEGSLRNFETFTNLDSIGLSPEYNDAVPSGHPGTLSESAKGFKFSHIEEVSSEFRKRSYYTDRVNSSDSETKSDTPLSPISSEDEENKSNIDTQDRRSGESDQSFKRLPDLDTYIGKPKAASTARVQLVYGDAEISQPGQHTCESPTGDGIDFKKYIISNDSVVQDEEIESESKQHTAEDICENKKSITTIIDAKHESTNSVIDPDQLTANDGQGGNAINNSRNDKERAPEEQDVNSQWYAVDEGPPRGAVTNCDSLIDHLFDGIASDGSDSEKESDSDDDTETLKNPNDSELRVSVEDCLVQRENTFLQATQEIHVDDTFVDNDKTDLKSSTSAVQYSEGLNPENSLQQLETCIDELFDFDEGEITSGDVVDTHRHLNDNEASPVLYHSTCIDDSVPCYDQSTEMSQLQGTTKETCLDDIVDLSSSQSDVTGPRSDVSVQYTTSAKRETCINDLFEDQIPATTPSPGTNQLSASILSTLKNKQQAKQSSQSRETCIDDVFESQANADTCQDVCRDSQDRDITVVQRVNTEENTVTPPLSTSTDYTCVSTDRTSTPVIDTIKQIEINQNAVNDLELTALASGEPTECQPNNSSGISLNKTEVKCQSESDTTDTVHSAQAQDYNTESCIAGLHECAQWKQIKDPKETIEVPHNKVDVHQTFKASDTQDKRILYEMPVNEVETKTSENWDSQREVQLSKEAKTTQEKPGADNDDNDSTISPLSCGDLDSVATSQREVRETAANLSLSNLGSYYNNSVGPSPSDYYTDTSFATPSSSDNAQQSTTRDDHVLSSEVSTPSYFSPSESDFVSDEGFDLHNEFTSGDAFSSLDSNSFVSDRDDESLNSIARSYNSLQEAFEHNRSRVLDREAASRIVRTPVHKPSDFTRRSFTDVQGAKRRVNRHKAKLYFSVLQQPVTPEKVHLSFSTPTKEVPLSRQRISQSRQKFLSAENLADNVDDKFLQHRLSLLSSTPRKYLKRHERHLQSTESLPADYSFLDNSFSSTGSMDNPPLPPRSPKNIEQLYSTRYTQVPSPRPDFAHLHDNCIFSPQKQEEIRHSTKSLENMFEQLLRYGSISSLVETDLDTVQTSLTDQYEDTDISDYVSFQYPLERAASMSALTGSSDGHRLPRKPGKGRFASRQVPKSKSLQTLETNLDDVFADEMNFAGGEMKKTPSVHELRVSKSLSKLTVPDWFKKSSFSRSGSTQSLFTYARQGSTSTLGSCAYPLSVTSSPSPSVTPNSNAVIIKTRVTPTSSSSNAARLIRAPMLPTTPEKAPIHPTSSVVLPSDKYRQSRKKDLKPITIVPFAKIREMFEKRSRKKEATSEAASKPKPKPQVDLSPTGEKPVHVSELASKFQHATQATPKPREEEPDVTVSLSKPQTNNHQVPSVPERKSIISDRSKVQTLDPSQQNQQQFNSLPRRHQVHFSDEKQVSKPQEQISSSNAVKNDTKPQSSRPQLPMPKFKFGRSRPAPSAVSAPTTTTQSKKGKEYCFHEHLSQSGLHAFELRARTDGEHLFEFLQKRRYSSLLENNFAEQLNDLQRNSDNVFSFPVLSIGEHSSSSSGVGNISNGGRRNNSVCVDGGPEDIQVILTNACLNQIRNGCTDSSHFDDASLEEVLEGLLALKEQREAAVRMEGVRGRLNLSADYLSSPDSPPGLQGIPSSATVQLQPEGYVSDVTDDVFKDSYDNLNISTIEGDGDDDVDGDYVLIRCENPVCERETNLREARKCYKTCHSCFTYYCCRNCRQINWDKHKQQCVYSRINSACKHVVKYVNRDPELQYFCSRLARRGYLAQGRGCVMFAFPDLSSAEDFLYYGLQSLWIPPVYISLKNLQEAPMLGDHLELLTNTCQQYNPELKYVIHVAIVIPPRLPPSPIPRRSCTIIQKVAKLRLSPAHMHPKPHDEPEEPTTMILTAVPGNTDSDGTNDRKARELCFINIQRKLRHRGVSLRHQYPNVYNKLIDFVSDSKRFSPLIIYPVDKKTGKRFMCVIMPESEPEIEWIRGSDAFRDLELFDELDYDSSPLNLSAQDLCGPDSSL